MRIALVLTVLVVAAHPAAAQGRKTQIVTGISLASLGIYAATMDRDCDVHPQTTLVAGRCEWRTARGVLAGLPPELPPEQLAAGLTVAAIGGMMAGGAWGAIEGRRQHLHRWRRVALAGDRLRRHLRPRHTVHVDAGDGRRLTTCPDPRHWSYSWTTRDYDLGIGFCRHESLSRIHMMWSGFAALGLAAGRALWRDEPPLTVDLRPGAVWVGRTIAF